MYDHHRASIANATRFFAQDPDVLALLLGGSLAHGFATATSDIDLLIIVGDAAYRERQRDNRLLFFNKDLCTYPDGYVDGKYLCPSFLQRVRERGSEPARFAFQDTHILLSCLDGLTETLQAIASYPQALKANRIQRFYAQFDAWHWYTQEAQKHDNRYLLNLAVSKLVLFGGRLVLAHNEQLYPYHKWFLRVLEQVPDKPADLLPQIADVLARPDRATIERFYETIKTFRDWEISSDWPVHFLTDSELTWLDDKTPVDDL